MVGMTKCYTHWVQKTMPDGMPIRQPTPMGTFFRMKLGYDGEAVS